MTKKIRLSMLIAFLALVVVGLASFGKVKVSADQEAGETKYADLDGDGKKESIKVLYSKKGASVYQAKLIINNKEVALLAAGSKNYDVVTVSVVNINSKDKFKEVVVALECNGSDFSVYRYNKGKVSLLFSAEYSGKHLTASESFKTMTKKNQVTLIETKGGPFGYIHVSAVYKIKSNGKLKLTSKTMAATYTPKHYSVVSTELYTSTKFTSVSGILNKGDEFVIKKVKIDKSGNIIAAYIKTTGKIKGWINVKGFGKDDIIVANPIYW